MGKKVVVAGGRDYNDKKRVFKLLDKLYEDMPDIEIVCGMPNGADALGYDWATSRNVKCHEFPANWNKYKKRAGYLRNREMAEFSDYVVVFWDGKSRGTKMMIDLAEEFGLPTAIYNY